MMARRATRQRSIAQPKLAFNHAMIYVRDVDCALRFYRDLLGFRLIEEYRHAGRAGYARLRSPAGQTTIALHALERGMRVPRRECLRLYFEVRQLRRFCRALAAEGARFRQQPKKMPWGWEHAYLLDPDGHEVSLYWAGRKRLEAGH
jgi:catechol 2,3-dioxygenase-like lactoylglutathione lyase family enzyme